MAMSFRFVGIKSLLGYFVVNITKFTVIEYTATKWLLCFIDEGKKLKKEEAKFSVTTPEQWNI